MVDNPHRMVPARRTTPEPDSDAALEAALSKVAQLEQALVSSRIIGAAVGVIMTLEKLPYESAFEMLSRASQQQSRKLRDLADEIVSFGTVLGRAV